MESVPDEIERTVGKAQIHYRKEKSEDDLVLELDSRSLGEQEEQRQQEHDDNAAVDICHTVSDIRICSYHESSEEVEKVILKTVIDLQSVARRGAVLKDQVCRDSQSCRSACREDARKGEAEGCAYKSLKTEPAGISLGLLAGEEADIICRSKEHHEQAEEIARIVVARDGDRESDYVKTDLAVQKESL